MCASACRKEAAPGSGHHGGAADYNDRGRLLYHGILSGGNTSVTSCLEKSIKNKKTGRVPAWKLFLFFTLYSVSFSGISHTRSKDIRSARSWKDRKSTRLNSSHVSISYAVFCLKKKNKHRKRAISR